MRRIVEEGKARAETILREHISQIRSIAKALLENETLSGSDVRDLLGGAAMVRFDEAHTKAAYSALGLEYSAERLSCAAAPVDEVQPALA
jgi:cell division protease FtsH